MKVGVVEAFAHTAMAAIGTKRTLGIACARQNVVAAQVKLTRQGKTLSRTVVRYLVTLNRISSAQRAAAGRRTTVIVTAFHLLIAKSKDEHEE